MSYDKEKTGQITLDEFKYIMRTNRHLTPREKNLLIRLQRSDKINYMDFSSMLYNVRYEISCSELMETGISELEAELVSIFRKYECKETHPGKISIADCEKALQHCKLLSLTPFQIHVLLGLSDCDGESMLEYIPFAKICVEYIDHEYRFEILTKKSEIEMIRMKEDPNHSAEHPSISSLDEIELFRTFKRYDRNMNGVLEFPEYTQCLSEAPNIDLKKNEIVTLALAADLNGDGRIDFEEFMKHYSTCLNMIHFNKHLSDEYLARFGKFKHIAAVDLNEVGSKVQAELKEAGKL